MKRLTLAWLAAVALLLCSVVAVPAATITIGSSMNWSAISPTPSSSDAVVIQNGAFLTNNVSDAVCASLQVGSSGDGTIRFASGSVLTCAGNVTLGSGGNNGLVEMISGGTLKVGGNLTLANAGSTFNAGTSTGTVEYNATTNQTITILTSSYNRLTTSGGGTKSLAGALNVDGILTIGVGTTVDVTASNFGLSVKGAWSNSGSFNGRAGTVNFVGTSIQNVSGTTTFNSLTLSNTAGMTLQSGASVTVNSNVTLAAGRITTGANVLMLGTGSSIFPSNSTTYVFGTLQKAFNSGAGQSFTFPIGSSSTRYTPIIVTSLTVTNPGSITASTTAGDHFDIANSGINFSRDANRYWTLTAGGGLGVSNCNATFQFVSLDLDGGSPKTTNFLVRRYDGTSWSTTTTGTRTTTNTQATGLSALGDFAVGEQLIDHYVVSAASPQTAGTPFITTVEAQDILNQTVADSSTVVTMSSSGSAVFDSDGNAAFDDPQKTLVNGTFSISTKDDAVEAVDIVAMDDFGRTGTRSGVVINPGSGTTLTFVQQPTGTTAGATISPAVTVRVQDSLGNNLPNISVTLTIGSGSGSLSGTTTRTSDGSGIATFDDLSISSSGSKTLRASIGGSPVDSNPFTISGATVTKLTFTTQPGNASAGAVFGTQPVVKSQDSFGNDSANGLPANLSLTISISSGSGPLQGTTTIDIGTAAGNGVATFSDLRIDSIGTKQLTAQASGLTSGVSSNFLVGAGTATRLAIQTQPSITATAGVLFAQQPVVRVEDQFGNLLTNDNSTVVIATRFVGSGTLQGRTNITVVGGVATFTNLSHNVANNISIAFTSGSLASTSSTIVAVSPAAFTKLQALVPGENNAPGSATGKSGTASAETAGTAFNVTVNAVDNFWNIVSTVSDTVSIGMSDSNATPPSNLALSGGAQTFSVTFKTAGTHTVTASDVTDGSKTAGTSSSFTVNAGLFTKLQLLSPGETAAPGTATGKTGTPSAQSAGSAFTVTVNAVDANWNFVSTATDTIAITSSDSNATLPGNAALIAGRTNFSVTLKTGPTATVTASDASDGGKAADTSPAITVNAGTATQLVIQTQPSTTATAGTSFVQQPAIRIADAFGNVVTSDNSTVVTAARSAGSGTLQGTLTATAVNGVATFANLSHNVATTITIQFTSGSFAAVTSGNVVVSAATATRLAFVTQPGNATAGSVFGTQPVLKTRDAFGNDSAVGLPGSLTVSMALSSGSGPLQGTTNLNIGTGGGNGTVTYTDLRIDNSQGTKQLTASASAMTNAVSSNFVVNAASASKLTIQTQPSGTATAGVAFAQQPVVRVEDGFGNLISSDNSTVVTATRNTGSGALQGSVTAQAVNGVAAFTNLFHTVANTITIQFNGGGYTAANSSSVVVNPTNATRLAFSVQPGGAVAGSVFGTQPVIKTRDAFDNDSTVGLGSSVTVSMALSAGTGPLQGTTNLNIGTSGGNGTASYTNLRIDSAGSGKQLTATASGFSSASSSTFSVDTAPAAKLAMKVQPPTTNAVNAVFRTNTVVELQDQFGNPATNDNSTVVTVLPLGGTGTLLGTTNVTAASGLVTFTDLSYNNTNTINLKFTATGLTSVTSAPVVIVPRVFRTLQVLLPGETADTNNLVTGKSGTASNQTAGASYTITVRAVDDFWNLTNVTDTVHIASSDTNAVLVGDLALTNGTRVFTVTNKTAGSWTWTASDVTRPTVTPGVSSNVTVNAGAFAKLQALAPGETSAPGSPTGKAGTPASQTAGTGFNVTIRAVDANWNLISTNDTVSITSSDTNAILPTPAALVGGTKNLNVTLKTAGSATVTASNLTHSTITASTSGSIPVGAATFVKLQLLVPGETAAPGSPGGKVGTPSAQTAGTAFNVTVNAVDADWNVVTNVTDSAAITSSDSNATLPASKALGGIL